MHSLSITKKFNTPVGSLYEAWKNPTIMKKWFAPGDMTVPEAEVDFQEGGSYRIVMSDQKECSENIVGGTYKTIIENERLSFSWQWEGSEAITFVDLTFKPIDAISSELTLVHTEFETEEMRDKHDTGWNGCLKNLEKCETEVA